MKYEKLTNYISQLSKDQIGEWVIDTENDGTTAHPQQTSFVDYSETISELVKDVHNFVKDNPKLELNHYYAILEKNELKLSKDIDVSKLEAITLLALLVALVRAERFSEGIIKSYIDCGAVVNWLERLKIIDEEQ